MTNNNNIEILPWTPPAVAPTFPTENEVLRHFVKDEGWTTAEVVEFMNATYKEWGARILLTFDQWETEAMRWLS